MGGLRKEGLLDMGAPFVRGHQDDIEACRAVGQLQMLTQKHLGRGGDAGLLARQNSPSGLFMRFPAFDLDEGQMVAALCYEIDFATLGFVAVSENPVIFGFKEALGTAFGSDASLI
jgi:hypothetical protein